MNWDQLLSATRFGQENLNPLAEQDTGLPVAWRYLCPQSTDALT